jgi:hypothetical protein
MAVWSDGAARTPVTPPLPDLLPSPRHSRRLGEVVPGVLAVSAARRQDAMVSLSSTIPRPFDSFIGRAEELRAVKTLLSMHRLVTLTGVG